MLRILTLNVQGLNDKMKRDYLFQELLRGRYDIIALQEVHCTRLKAAQWETEWPGQSFWHSRTHDSGGVAVLFKPNLETVIEDVDMDFNGRVLALSIKVQSASFRLINIYACNPETRGEMENFYEELYTYFRSDLAHILLGDFNMVEDLSMDRMGGNPREKHTWGSMALDGLKSEFSLIDIWRAKHPNSKQFSWQSYAYPIQSRLDRIMTSSELTPLVNEVEIQPFIWSDHDSVVMDWQPPEPPPERGPGYWKLNTTLLQDPEYQGLIKNIWSAWQGKKDSFSNLLNWWDLGKKRIKEYTIGFATKRNREKRAYKQHLMSQYRHYTSLDPPNKERVDFYRKELQKYFENEAEKLFITTQSVRLEEGEKPTKYFYDLLKQKQQKKTLSEVKFKDENGEEKTSKEIFDILKISTSFYKDLYTAEKGLRECGQNTVLDLIDAQIAENERRELDADITKDELRAALHDSVNGKTPGCDGIPYEFYKTFWPILEDDFHEMQKHVFQEQKSLSPSQQRALISLLYKDGDKRDLANWRPISLLCTDYKLITKALADKIKKVLPSIIHPDQTCSVPGRQIHDNLYLTRDVIAYAEDKGIPGYIVTVDQEKAFDRVNRNLLFKIMKRFNFGEKIVNKLEIIYKNPLASLYINGFTAAPFLTSRGIRQGCPLSAILYVIYAEALGNMIRNNKFIHGMPLPGKLSNKATISQYADDTTFYLHARTSIDQLFITLGEFEQLSGSRIKNDKTQAICIGGAKIPKTSASITWVNEFGLDILGVTFFDDFFQTQSFNWTVKICQLKNYLDNHKDRKLTLKGKVIQLNTIAMANFWYLAKVIPTTIETIRSVEKLIFPFLYYPKKVESVARKTLYLPKDKGGIGLVNTELKARALMISTLKRVGDQSQHGRWLVLARYWLSSLIANLRPEWNHLGQIMNKAPRPDRLIGPHYYIRTVQNFKRINCEDFRWSVRDIYTALQNESKHTPKAVTKWPGIRNLDISWKSAFSTIHLTYNQGKYQDIHYLFIHLALPVRDNMVKWTNMGHTNPQCKVCRNQEENARETIIHMMFQCEKAWAVWERVKLYVQQLMPGSEVHPLRLAMGICPPNISKTIYYLSVTMIQLAMHIIWKNRCAVEFENEPPDIVQSVAKVRKIFKKIVFSLFYKAKRTNTLAHFRTDFCQNNNLLKLGNTLEVNFIADH